MNKGISLAKGNIIGFLNSDDFYANNDVLNSVAELFKKDSLFPVFILKFNFLIFYINKINKENIHLFTYKQLIV